MAMNWSSRGKDAVISRALVDILISRGSSEVSCVGIQDWTAVSSF